eukprot:4891603-Prymnesium_polylepis.1
MARSAGVQLQLYDIYADPAEVDDLLVVADSSGGAHVSTRRRNASVRGPEVAATMLGHYLSAVRVARRSIERAKSEGRNGHPQGRGYEMVVWFCRQVELSWTLDRWRDTATQICAERPDDERRTFPLPRARRDPARGAPTRTGR